MNERVDTVVVGGGQSGLATGYYLSRLGRRFVILDAGERVGDAWRRRWDSLRLFTPAKYDQLPGMDFPAPAWTFPTKDEMADYLESYAAHFDLPVRCGAQVEAVTPYEGRYLVRTTGTSYLADNVVVAMASYQRPWLPDFATDIDDGVVQMHSANYRNPAQLQPGPVLLVGAGNSASEIARELAPTHQVLMSGRDVGHIPFRIEGTAARLGMVRLVIRFVFHRVLTVDTPVGRKVRPKTLAQGGPLIRVKPKDLAAAGVERVPRVARVEQGRAVLEDGRRPEVANVVWCTGFRPDFSWVDVPAGEHEPEHRAGILPEHPGLYFVGLHFQYALSSTMVHGMARDAERVANHIAARRPTSGVMSGSSPQQISRKAVPR